MSNTPVSDEETTRLRIRILRALAASRFPREAIGAIAANNNLTAEDVKALVADYGFPDAAKMAEAALELVAGGKPTPAPPVPVAAAPAPVQAPRPTVSLAPTPAVMPATGDRTEALLTKAEKSDKARTRRLATKVREQLAELLGLVNSEEAERQATAAAAAEKARLRDEVEKLEAELAQKRAALKKSGGAAPATSSPAVDSKAVRAWAAENGVECKPFGRVSPEVVAAYEAAMAKAAS